MMMAGVCTLALLGAAGCAGTDSWFGGSDGSAGTAGAGTAGSSGSSVTGGSPGAGMPANPGGRDRIFYPDTLSGEGRWTNESDAPGAN